jgi:Concanavalin A-like lectin/glucanases superfamily
MPARNVSRRTLLGRAAVVAGAAATPSLALPAAHADPPNLSAYDRLVMSDQPVAYWRLSHPSHGSESDRMGNGYAGVYRNVTATVQLPNNDGGSIFNGTSGYFQVPSAPAFHISTTGKLTVEAWIRPDTLQFPDDEQTGYVHFIGKGTASGTNGNREWAGRFYSLNNSENRPNRISGYAWNLDGGLGAGAYFQDTLTVGTFIHFAVAFDVDEGEYGTVRIYRDGVLRQGTHLAFRPGTPDEVIITPRPGNAPVRVGTRDFGSYFKGVIAKVAIYDRRLTEADLRPHYEAMYA